MSTISVQIFSVRDQFAADPTGTFLRLRELGFENVEPFGLDQDRGELRAALAASGLSAPSSHANLLSASPSELESTLDRAAELGIGVVIHPGVGDGWDDPAAVRRIADDLNRIAGPAAARGLEVGYHNHWWELQEIEGRTGIEFLADLLDPAVRLEIDTYWAAVGEVDPAGLLGRLGDRVRLLHIKDGDLRRGAEGQVPAGEGRVDVPSVLAAAPEAIRVIEFDLYAGDIFDGLARSLRYVRATDAAS